MKKTHLSIGLAILLWGTSTAIGQIFSACDPCEPAACEPACEPCEPICSPCTGLFGIRPLMSTPFTFGGWVEMGIYGNGNGHGSDNGPMHTASNQRTDFLMNQFYLYGEKELNTRRGFDWGGRADLVYGVDGPGMQSWGDETFDNGWGTNKHGYGMAAYQLYGTLGYGDLSVKIGKFITPIGWEESASKNNVFYSHSYCYWIEPATHTGVLATYDVTDRFSINAGWTSGMDSFKNPDDNTALLAGFTYALSDDATIYYWLNQGKQYNLDHEARFNYFMQSLCLEWMLTSRFTYVLQYNVRNDNESGWVNRYSSYGINNHFLYALTDNVTTGMRVEWLRDNGGFGYVTGDKADYWNVTLGLRWDPYKNLSIRPEVRYDWCQGGATPFGAENHARKDQVSGGCGMLITF